MFKGGHLIAIDHGLSFRDNNASFADVAKKAMRNAEHWGDRVGSSIENGYRYKMIIPKVYKDRLKAFVSGKGFSNFSKSVKSLVSDDELVAMKERANLILTNWDDYFDTI